MTAEPREQPARTGTCPPWCVTDHETPLYPGGGPSAVHRGAATRLGFCAADLSTYPVDFGTREHPHVRVRETRYDAAADVPDPSLRLPAGDARTLAGIIGILADATPDQHREFAAGIERAAAEIEPEAGS